LSSYHYSEGVGGDISRECHALLLHIVSFIGEPEVVAVVAGVSVERGNVKPSSVAFLAKIKPNLE
jgi:hypothetical protein